MSDTPLRVGIIGAGHIASVHTRHLRRVPGATLAAIADLNQEKATALAEGTGVAVYGAAEELLAADTVDAVIVATPTDTHRALVEQALAAGKHVLCEKPMAVSTDDCQAMLSAAKSSGKTLSVGQVVRFFPEYANAKRLVESGAVGKPAAVRVKRAVSGRSSTAPWYSDPKGGGGVLFDLLVHEFDWLIWCFGPVARVYANALTPRLAAGEVPLDYALITLRHESGVVAHVEGSWNDLNGFSTTFEVAGDAGLLTHDSRQAASLRRGAHPSGPMMGTDDPYYRQLVAFTETCQTGEAKLATGEDGLRAVIVAAAAAESVATGRAVALVSEGGAE